MKLYVVVQDLVKIENTLEKTHSWRKNLQKFLHIYTSALSIANKTNRLYNENFCTFSSYADQKRSLLLSLHDFSTKFLHAM